MRGGPGPSGVQPPGLVGDAVLVEVDLAIDLKTVLIIAPDVEVRRRLLLALALLERAVGVDEAAEEFPLAVPEREAVERLAVGAGQLLGLAGVDRGLVARGIVFDPLERRRELEQVGRGRAPGRRREDRGHRRHRRRQGHRGPQSPHRQLLPDRSHPNRRRGLPSFGIPHCRFYKPGRIFSPDRSEVEDVHPEIIGRIGIPATAAPGKANFLEEFGRDVVHREASKRDTAVLHPEVMVSRDHVPWYDGSRSPPNLRNRWPSRPDGTRCGS